MMSVVPGVACLAASAVAGVVLRWMAARRARAIEAAGGEHRVHELRVALFRATRVAAVCGSVAAGGYLGAVLGQLSDPVAVLSALAVIVAGVAGPVAAARRPIASALARARGVPRARMTPRGLGMAALLFLIRFWPAIVGAAVPAGLAGRVGIVLLGSLVVSPVIGGLSAPVIARLLAAAELPGPAGARVQALAARAGVRVRGRLRHGARTKDASARQVGWLPGLRYLVVSDYLIASASPPELDAILAHELAHVRHQDVLVRQYLAAVQLAPVGVMLAIMVTGARDAAAYLGLALMWVIIVVSIRLASAIVIRQELAADDLAARVTGPAQLAAALARLAELNQIRPDTSARWDRSVRHPAIQRRLERLRQRAGAAPAGDAAPAGQPAAAPRPGPPEP